MTTGNSSALLAGTLSRVPASLVNHVAAGGVLNATLISPATTGAKSVLSGAVTANTYKEILAITGAGLLEFCAANTQDTTSRTVGLKIVADGVTIFDAVSSATSSATLGIVAVGGNGNGGVSYPIAFPVPFNVSLSVQIKSSISETDKIAALYSYRTF
ncbi:MAG: hypothetical protein V1784_03770 [bacterium]